jgi:L-ascorbate metabolism protein UlaG (beta-lactamase superfamily)
VRAETWLTYAGHSTLLIEMSGVRLLTDPVLRRRVAHLNRQVASPDVTCQDVDAVLISHLHWDHLDIPSLRLLNSDARLIVPPGVGDRLWARGFRRMEELRVGQSTTVGSLQVTATPAEHTGGLYPFGPTSECIGFLIGGSYQVYFAGDTDLFPEMATIEPNLDAALLPVWGWGPRLGTGHMDPQRAAEALTVLRPRVAVPIHWGTFCPIGVAWLRPQFLWRPPRAFERHASALTPEVEVRVLDPGESFCFEQQLGSPRRRSSAAAWARW